MAMNLSKKQEDFLIKVYVRGAVRRNEMLDHFSEATIERSIRKLQRNNLIELVHINNRKQKIWDITRLGVEIAEQIHEERRNKQRALEEWEPAKKKESLKTLNETF